MIVIHANTRSFVGRRRSDVLTTLAGLTPLSGGYSTDWGDLYCAKEMCPVRRPEAPLAWSQTNGGESMGVQIATVGETALAYEVFGSSGHPPLVLVMGLATQMIGWPDEFCELLASEGFQVVRFDNRDVGLSTHFDRAGTPDLTPIFSGGAVEGAPYTLVEMAADTVGLLDSLGLDRVHLVGASMGGMIAQEVAVRFSERLLSLTSIMSTPAPHIGAPTAAANVALLTPPPSSIEEAGARSVAVYRVIGSPGYPLDEAALIQRGQESFRRGNDPAGVARQLAAIHASGDRTDALRKVRVPTLVLHGADDPLIRVAGAVATAEAVADSRLVTYAGMGHDLPRALWPRLVGEISDHARRAARQDSFDA
jgi:pimeloyl-ACP methyl ester carboxylesterase